MPDPVVGGTPRAPRLLIAAAALYTAFVAYGSLVPLNYRPLPWAEALSVFSEMRPLHVPPASRTDWAANFLLLVPLPFLWLAALDPRGAPVRVLACALAWAGSFLFSIAIEFAQIFFPPRNPSMHDIAAQGLGAATGVVAWWIFGSRFRHLIERSKTARGAPGVAEWVLWPYLVVLFFYNVMPLDLTASPAALFHKWQEGHVVLIPFTRLADDPGLLVYGLATDILVWAPVAALWVLSGKMSPARAWLCTALAAALIEGVQLLVQSRVADTTDVVTAAMGGGLGAWAGSHLRHRAGVTGGAEPLRPGSRSWTLVGALGSFLWLFVILALFWYPFDFALDRSLAQERLPMLWRVPFRTYWSGSEFRALTEVLHKVLFFAPLGVGLGIAAIRLRGRRVFGFATAGALLVIFLAALGVELGQVLLPGKVPDSTDVVLESCGGFAGYWSVMFLQRRLGRPEGEP